jgi:phosphoglucosamine mutase
MKLFGTDGIRGEAGKYPLDGETLFRAGACLGRLLTRGGGDPLVVIGGDTRESTPRIASWVAAGLGRAGTRVEHAGTVTTPAVADLVRLRAACAGIAVSASHNPWQDNGIKIFGSDGRKLSDALEVELEGSIAASDLRAPDSAPSLPVDPALRGLAVEALRPAAPRPLSGLRVLLDCANGAATEMGPLAFRNAGALVETIFAHPDGRNINEGCGAVHPEALASRAAAGGFDVGVAFDGDADRAILADERGRVLDGDDVLWMLARQHRREGRLDPSIVVGTVMTNFGLERTLAREGISLRRTPVGDRHVARAMEETGAELGGEPSGHVVIRSLSSTGDGIRTALQICSLLVSTGGPLSSIADLEKTPQQLRNVAVRRRLPLDEVVALARAVASAQDRLAGTGRVLLRYSGTEPLLRVMVEGADAALVEELADALAKIAARELEAR